MAKTKANKSRKENYPTVSTETEWVTKISLPQQICAEHRTTKIFILVSSKHLWSCDHISEDCSRRQAVNSQRQRYSNNCMQGVFSHLLWNELIAMTQVCLIRTYGTRFYREMANLPSEPRMTILSLTSESN